MTCPVLATSTGGGGGGESRLKARRPPPRGVDRLRGAGCENRCTPSALALSHSSRVFGVCGVCPQTVFGAPPPPLAQTTPRVIYLCAGFSAVGCVVFWLHDPSSIPLKLSRIFQRAEWEQCQEGLLRAVRRAVLRVPHPGHALPGRQVGHRPAPGLAPAAPSEKRPGHGGGGGGAHSEAHGPWGSTPTPCACTVRTVRLSGDRGMPPFPANWNSLWRGRIRMKNLSGGPPPSPGSSPPPPPPPPPPPSSPSKSPAKKIAAPTYSASLRSCSGWESDVHIE